MDQIIFLGTGGARVVVSKQIRASGGMWFTVGRTNFVVDPGPGALVRATAKRKPKLDPTRLDGIILSHGHLDHYPSPDLLGSLIWRFALNSKYQYNVIRGVAPHLAVVAPFGWL